MRLKVCGITAVAQLQELQALGIVYAGLIFYEKSKRYAHEKLQFSTSEIRELKIQKVGVFVNTDMAFLKRMIRAYGLSAVQLHGDEPPEFCEAVRGEAAVIKVFRIKDEMKHLDEVIAPFQNVSDYFLFDTDTAAYGGSGQRFDWSLLEKSTIGKPFFLSGGIGPDDIGKLKRFRHPCLYAVDINSRFETAPGLKDMSQVETFANALKQPLYG